MKGVPVRRLTLPRIPAPPETLQAAERETMPAPSPDADGSRGPVSEGATSR